MKFKRSVKTPVNGWQGARHGSVGFVQSVQDGNILVVSFCTGVARVLVNEVIKVIPLDRGQLVRLKAAIEKPRFDWCSIPQPSSKFRLHALWLLILIMVKSSPVIAMT